MDDTQNDDSGATSAEDALAVMPAFGALASTESARDIAQVQALALLARAHPRDESRAIETILSACDRPSLADKATYVYSRGGEEISGPTIRLAETVLQAWGNMSCKVSEVSRDAEEGISRCVARGVDLQSGNSDEREFMVRHWRDLRGGKGYRVTTERDIRELIFNYGARNKRAIIQALVPAWVFEEAVERCENTLYETVRVDAEALASMLASFSKIDITREHIEARIRAPLEQIQPSQMIHLHKIYNSLRGQDSSPGDWFDIVDAATGGGTASNTIDDIAARTRSRKDAHAKRTPPDKAHVGDDIERQIRESKTLDELNTATLKIGPLEDMKLKGKLYDLAQSFYEALGGK